ncbi:peroxiredoxin [Rubinisphaera margarita]|uniref:peroxiredoxin n=1 Tax=Rubinisphaera margarita TaxID=2909586 RepID=UPI001EE84B14|nr:peroxiredoxin [Rubinisphaera margarita]MCG6157960.1 peroxiredoxin [Rubinisphaera margarita]
MKMYRHAEFARPFALAVACLFLGITLGSTQPVMADDVNVGDDAPKFSARDDQGNVWKSENHVGKKILVVYFYPADMTGGCTKQACGFRDDMAQLQGADVEVVGVSGDTVESHQLFKKVYDLNFTLLADTEGEVAKAFGVPTRPGGSIERTVDSQNFVLTRGVTANRWTFVVDKNGKVVHKDTSVNAAADSEKIMQVVQKLK